LFLSAHRGTLFLDEIGELEPSLQAALLRAIETRKVRPLGQAHEEEADVRILCATNRNLQEMVQTGKFREDLFYRINQHSLRLPPLRDRGEDISLLAYHFLEKARQSNPGKIIADFHPETLSALRRYAWPGNIRELANAVSKGVILARSSLVTIEFPKQEGSWITMGEAVRGFQRDYAQKAVDACGGDKEKAAEILGVGRSTLFNYLAEIRKPLNIEP
jgi:DNA-binding NtrC family response regulator